MAAHAVPPLSYRNIRLLRTAFLQLHQQQQDGVFCDVILQAEGESILAHRCVLSAFSQYLRGRFSSEEPHSHKVLLELHELKAKTLKKLVDFIYTSEIQIQLDEAEEVLQAARFLQIQELENLELEGGKLAKNPPSRRINRDCFRTERKPLPIFAQVFSHVLPESHSAKLAPQLKASVALKPLIQQPESMTPRGPSRMEKTGRVLLSGESLVEGHLLESSSKVPGFTSCFAKGGPHHIFHEGSLLGVGMEVSVKCQEEVGECLDNVPTTQTEEVLSHTSAAGSFKQSSLSSEQQRSEDSDCTIISTESSKQSSSGFWSALLCRSNKSPSTHPARALEDPRKQTPETYQEDPKTEEAVQVSQQTEFTCKGPLQVQVMKSLSGATPHTSQRRQYNPSEKGRKDPIVCESSKVVQGNIPASKISEERNAQMPAGPIKREEGKTSSCPHKIRISRFKSDPISTEPSSLDLRKRGSKLATDGVTQVTGKRSWRQRAAQKDTRVHFENAASSNLKQEDLEATGAISSGSKPPEIVCVEVVKSKLLEEEVKSEFLEDQESGSCFSAPEEWEGEKGIRDRSRKRLSVEEKSESIQASRTKLQKTSTANDWLESAALDDNSKMTAKIKTTGASDFLKPDRSLAERLDDFLQEAVLERPVKKDDLSYMEVENCSEHPELLKSCSEPTEMASMDHFTSVLLGIPNMDGVVSHSQSDLVFPTCSLKETKRASPETVHLLKDFGAVDAEGNSTPTAPALRAQTSFSSLVSRSSPTNEDYLTCAEEPWISPVLSQDDVMGSESISFSMASPQKQCAVSSVGTLFDYILSQSPISEGKDNPLTPLATPDQCSGSQGPAGVGCEVAKNVALCSEGRDENTNQLRLSSMPPSSGSSTADFSMLIPQAADFAGLNKDLSARLQDTVMDSGGLPERSLEQESDTEEANEMKQCMKESLLEIGSRKQMDSTACPSGDAIAVHPIRQERSPNLVLWQSFPQQNGTSSESGEVLSGQTDNATQEDGISPLDSFGWQPEDWQEAKEVLCASDSEHQQCPHQLPLSWTNPLGESPVGSSLKTEGQDACNGLDEDSRKRLVNSTGNFNLESPDVTESRVKTLDRVGNSVRQTVDETDHARSSDWQDLDNDCLERYPKVQDPKETNPSETSLRLFNASQDRLNGKVLQNDPIQTNESTLEFSIAAENTTSVDLQSEESLPRNPLRSDIRKDPMLNSLSCPTESQEDGVLQPSRGSEEGFPKATKACPKQRGSCKASTPDQSELKTHSSERLDPFPIKSKGSTHGSLDSTPDSLRWKSLADSDEEEVDVLGGDFNDEPWMAVSVWPDPSSDSDTDIEIDVVG
ncbi:uncharacterized protein LOC106706573 [Latimeria chalumnae]|nr:PREDICTED: BTB/POZ domain-containing protein 18 [Latimeria chalumnae]|eukprot:XP_014353188.1 PREDICTED: BTB/POZ domain-containing protein 18 [Latimeria chalumnae]